LAPNSIKVLARICLIS